MEHDAPVLPRSRRVVAREADHGHVVEARSAEHQLDLGLEIEVDVDLSGLDENLLAVDQMGDPDLERGGLLERVEIVGGDFYVDALPAGHDLVLLSAIIHQNGPAQNRALYEKCRDALEPGGSLVIRDILMDDAHTEPAGGALFALHMLVATEGGGTYDHDQARRDLEAAGFVDVQIIRRGAWMDSLISARRPG